MIYRRRAATSFMEYALVLGISSAVLMGMFTYAKRGLQGKVKDLSDAFIGSEQETSSAVSDSIYRTNSVSNSSGNFRGELGGGTKLSSSEIRDIDSVSVGYDKNNLYAGHFFDKQSAEAYNRPGNYSSAVAAAASGAEKQELDSVNDRNNHKRHVNLVNLYNGTISGLNNSTVTVETEAGNLRATANTRDCDDDDDEDTCEAARAIMYANAAYLENDANAWKKRSGILSGIRDQLREDNIEWGLANLTVIERINNIESGIVGVLKGMDERGETARAAQYRQELESIRSDSSNLQRQVDRMTDLYSRLGGG
ncbi:MAG: hypothetical protein WC628_00765 [Candidatus Omnitrophota bacterium]